MKNKSNVWYYMLIVVFTVLFFACMAFCFGRFRQLSRGYMTRSGCIWRLRRAERGREKQKNILRSWKNNKLFRTGNTADIKSS